MSVNLPTHFIEEYTTNVAHLLQYKGTKYRGAVTEGSYHSNGGVVVDQYGAVSMSEVVGRFADMPRTDAALDRIWIYPKDYDLAQMVDTFDKLRLMTDPKGPLAEAAAMAARAKIDDVISGAFFGSVKSGTDGSTTDTFDTTNHRVDAAVGASADTGLNVEKILQARRMMQNLEIDFDMEECYLGISPDQEEDLLRQQQVINNDYNSSLGVVLDGNGNVRRFAGCNVIVSTKTPTNSSYTLCPMWVKSGMHLGVWSDIKARVDDRPDIQGVPYQLYTTVSIAATRVEAGRVIQIECV